MKVGLNDIAHAEKRAFQVLFPSGLAKWKKKPRWEPVDANTRHGKYGFLDAAINARGKAEVVPGKYATLAGAVNTSADKQKRSRRYIWSNTLYIIRSRIKRGEPWKTPGAWGNGAGSEEHRIVALRIARRMDGRKRTRKQMDTRWWAAAMRLGL